MIVDLELDTGPSTRYIRHLGFGSHPGLSYQTILHIQTLQFEESIDFLGQMGEMKDALDKDAKKLMQLPNLLDVGF